MALNIAKSGYETTAFDLRSEAVSHFVSSSSTFTPAGIGASSIIETATSKDFLVLMVVNDSQARTILLAPSPTKTALEVLAPNAHVVLMATCSPASVAALERDVKAVRPDVELVDAPVSGGVSGSTHGTLTIMAGCPTHAFQHASPILRCMGDKIHHMGEQPGKGNSMKAINQVLCGIHVAAAAEALSLAKKMDIDASKALEIVSNSAASSWMLKDRGPRMLQDEPEIHSMTQIFVKDLGIVADAGREVGAALPLSVAAHQMFVAGVGRGQKYMDDSTVVRCYDALNGVRKE